MTDTAYLYEYFAANSSEDSSQAPDSDSGEDE